MRRTIARAGSRRTNSGILRPVNPLRSPAVRAALLAGLMSSAGCLSTDVLVTVHPDGSGTITHTVKRFKSASAALESLPTRSRSHAHVPQPQREEEISEAAVREHARRFGKQVRLLSTTRLAGDDIDGRRSVYAFDRIQDVVVDLLPSVPGADFYFGFPWMPAPTDARVSTELAFDLEAREDGTRVLTARFPDFRFDPAANPPFSSPSPAAAAQPPGAPDETALVRAMLRNARVDIRVRTSTPLVRTNSPHREGNDVELMSLDIERLISAEQIARLVINPASLDEVRWALHDMDGARIALDRDIRIEFSGPPEQAQPSAPPPPQAPPDTEIFLAPLSMERGALKIGTPRNISNSAGYDNQPSFTPDGGAILFASARGGAATDIYRFDLATGAVRQVTATPESEYSPTVMPDGRHISVVRVEADGTQRLWRFALDGSQPALVLPDVKPVGYHAWIDDRRLALFVLGEPPTLQVVDSRGGRPELVAKDIGRSLHRIPKGGLSFVQIDQAAGGPSPTLTIMEFDGEARVARRLIQAMPGTTEADLAWTPDGTLLMARGGTLYMWRRGDVSWTAAADLAALGLRGVTRLAVSPAGDRLAIVAQPAGRDPSP